MDRIAKLLSQLEGKVLLVEDSVDLLYLTHLDLSLGKLLLEEGKATLFVDGRYFEQAKEKGTCQVAPLASWEEYVKSLPQVYIDPAKTSVEQLEAYRSKNPHISWKQYPHPCKTLRWKKEEREIASLQKAASLTREGTEYLFSLLSAGVEEKDLAAQFAIFCLQKGAQGLSFPPIIAFGPSSAHPHHRAGNRQLQEGDIVLCDVGAVWDHYAGDRTRCKFFGQAPKKLLGAYHLLEEITKRAIERIEVGVTLGSIDAFVRQELEKRDLLQFFTHSLSHGVGLEVHEAPFSRQDRDVPLEEGMVFTVEPGVYFPQEGGVRYEETILVTHRGAVVLT